MALCGRSVTTLVFLAWWCEGLAPAARESAGEVVASAFASKDFGPALEALCSDDVVLNDLARGETRGRDAVVNALKGARVVERTAGNETTGGLTWYREQDGRRGLRGTTYVRFDDKGLLAYLQEASEPIFKAGPLTEALLKAATQNVVKEKEVTTPSYTERTPTSASDVVRYLWQEASPNGASPEVALGLFADDILYEDFNYAAPFEGIDQVRDFVEAFDIPGIEFVPMEISGGDGTTCCFTWKVVVNGNDGPQGVSFYEVDPSTKKVTYVRDIPATKPAPLQRLADLLNPDLGVFF